MEYLSNRPAWLYSDAGDESLQSAFDVPGRWWDSNPAVSIIVGLFGGAAVLAAIAVLMLLLVARPAAARPALVTSPPDTGTYDNQMNQFLSCRPGAPVRKQDELADHLAMEFRESHVATVLMTSVALAELYVNPETGTYTVLRVNPHGMACVALAGTYRSGPLEIEL